MGQSQFNRCCLVEEKDTHIMACCPSKALGSSAEIVEVDIKIPASQAFRNQRILDLVKEQHLEDLEDRSTADTVLVGASSTAGRLTGDEDTPTVDFGGAWLCTRVTGDVNNFMKDVGLGPVMREAAKAAQYGAGRQVQNIAQVGDAFIVQNLLKDPITMRFRVGAGVQSTFDQDGKEVFVDPQWNGDMLCIVTKRKDGSLIATSRRYMDGDAMVLELTSPKGAVVRRVFEKT
mmetsp:Transcript_76394/g.224092  ORF Transcript_76394/g.224092 Transcript_76394/m.224092 type:complete len:232 (-) Transcript_76394:177-872(-)